MKILFRRRILTEIYSLTELENFIKEQNFYKFFKKFPNDKIFEIEGSITSTESIPYKGIKPWLKKILDYPETIYDKKFLHSMGWEENEIINFISEKQQNNSLALSDKKLKNPEKYYNKCPKRVEYWMDKGFSVDESKLKVSESQKTFSKNICIEKYGEDEGIRVFNKRQKKWIKTLSLLENYDEVQTKKNSYNYGFKDSIELINRSSFLECVRKNIIKHLNSSSINEFVNKILDEIDYKSYSDIHPYINSKIIQKHYNVDYASVKQIFNEKTSDNLTRNIYGTPIYHNNIRFKSIKEYKIALWLESQSLHYIYEKQYPNSKYKSDFYLPEKDIYIEYYGMLDKKNENKLDKIQLNYKHKMNEKNLYCELNTILLIQDTNLNNLFEKLKTIL